MEVSWNGATPKSSILDWDFPLTNDFGDPPFMETPMLPATGFLTSYQPQFHQKSRCSTAKFQVLPKVQWLSHHFKFQISGSFQRFRYFQISGTSNFRYFTTWSWRSPVFLPAEIWLSENDGSPPHPLVNHPVLQFICHVWGYFRTFFVSQIQLVDHQSQIYQHVPYWHAIFLEDTWGCSWGLWLIRTRLVITRCRDKGHHKLLIYIILYNIYIYIIL